MRIRNGSFRCGRTLGDFLARRNDAALAKALLPKISNVLIVEDETFDADRLEATVNIILGRDEITVRRAQTLDKAIDAVLKSIPDMVFLDDYLRPSDSALETIPMLRRAGYEGPIIVISGEVDRPRNLALRRAGAAETIHKDDVNSVKLSEALARVFRIDLD